MTMSSRARISLPVFSLDQSRASRTAAHLNDHNLPVQTHRRTRRQPSPTQTRPLSWVPVISVASSIAHTAAASSARTTTRGCSFVAGMSVGLPPHHRVVATSALIVAAVVLVAGIGSAGGRASIALVVSVMLVAGVG
jgi:hypothetical protein